MNIEKYNKIFMEVLNVSEDELCTFKYQDSDWDSIGHMHLMAEIEDGFEIELDADDIIDFSSYEKGKEILSKYNISFE